MAAPPRVRSMNIDEPETRPVLVPGGNKARPEIPRKPASKPLKKVEKQSEKESEPKDKKKASNSPKCETVPSILRKSERQMVLLRSNFSMNGSCSSDASSSDSSQSRASSSGRMVRRSSPVLKKKSLGQKTESENVVGECNLVDSGGDGLGSKKRCAWVTPNTEPCYVAFHDGEWGLPVHDDKKLFELLSLSGALAELTWPAILNKRQLFRDVFLDFDPFAVAKLNEKKIGVPGSPSNSLLSEPKLRGIVENARQICKVIDEFGSFDKYIWGFINNKPVISQFRYPRQVPVKTSKAEVISKDLVKRGFRSVGPTVVYSFMQVAGLTNDHLISCFRFQECCSGATGERDDKNCGGVERVIVA